MKLPNKIKLTIAVALVASGLWLLKPQQDTESVVAAQAPTVEAPVHFDSAVHYDSAVMPARADVDGSASPLGKSASGSKVRTAVYETARDQGYTSNGVFIDDAVELCQGSCGCEGLSLIHI